MIQCSGKNSGVKMFSAEMDDVKPLVTQYGADRFFSRSELPANTVAKVESPVPSSSQGGGHNLYPALHGGCAQPHLVGRQDRMSVNMTVEVHTPTKRDEEKSGDLPFLKHKGEKPSQSQSGMKEVEKMKREEEELLERL